MLFEKIKADNFEQIVFCNDTRVGLKAIIAMHSTVLGPATGGCRMWDYKNDEEAMTDVLRLSKGMTYKASLAGLDWGGGKAVIMGDPKKAKSKEMLERFGEMVDRLGGNYITAKDVGIGADDLKTIKNKTKHVLGIEGEPGSSGDPSPGTAWGVYHGIRSCAKFAFGAQSLSGLKISLQGLGSVNYYLIEHLLADGAKIVGTDIDQTVIDRAVKKYGIEVIKPQSIYDYPCDIFSPGALGAIVNSETIPMLKCKIVAGASNNQLKTPDDGHALMKRGIVYAPDYAINAGGLINIYHETHDQGGYNKGRAFDHIAKVGPTIATILDRAKAENQPTFIIADRMAEERVEKARKSAR